MGFNIDEEFGGSLISAKDKEITKKGVMATIVKVTKEEIGGDEKLVVKLEGKGLPVDQQGAPKPFGLNKTNALAIREQYGPDTDKWTGKEIRLYQDKTNYQGELVACVRVDAGDGAPF